MKVRDWRSARDTEVLVQYGRQVRMSLLHTKSSTDIAFNRNSFKHESGTVVVDTSRSESWYCT